MKMKKVLVAIVVSAMMAGLIGCSSKDSGGNTNTDTNTSSPTGVAESNSTKGGEVVVDIAMTTTMGDLDPFAPPTQGRNFLRYAVYDNIAIFKDFGTSWDKMQWVIAKNITQVDDVTFDIEIYDYVYDAAGNQITADDVVYCLNGMSTSGNYTRFTNYMESAKVIDDYNLEIKLKTTTVGAIEYIFAQCCIVDKDTYETNKDKFSTTPITTGAYQVAECVPGSYYTLKKNPNYWQKDESLRSYTANQQVDTFKYNVITEATQATIALQMKEDDLITVSGNSEIGYFMNPDGTPVKGYSVNKVLSSTTTVLSFNMAEDGGLFADNLALRQAVSYAINREDIVAGGLRGNGEIMNDLASQDCGDYNKAWDNEEYYDYDLDKAKTLLADAGYAKGIDPATGKPLHVRFLVDQQYKDTAVVLQSQLIALGLDCEILAYDNSLIASYQYDPTQWDIYMYIQGTECYVTSVYDGIFAAGADGMAPKCFVKDEKLQKLINAAHDISTHDEGTVEALHDYVYDNAYSIGLYQSYTFSVGVDTIKLVNHPWGQLVGPACDYTEFIKAQ